MNPNYEPTVGTEHNPLVVSFMPERKGYTIEVDSIFIKNQMGVHLFSFDKGDKRPMAGTASIHIPAACNPLAFEYGDKVRITIEKISAPKKNKKSDA